MQVVSAWFPIVQPSPPSLSLPLPEYKFKLSPSVSRFLPARLTFKLLPPLCFTNSNKINYNKCKRTLIFQGPTCICDQTGYKGIHCEQGKKEKYFYVIQQKNCKLMSVVGSLFVELCALDHFYLLDNNQYLVYFLFWSLATCCVH